MKAPLPFLAILLFGARVSAAQTTLEPADYGRWETLEDGSLSPDGRWLAASVSRVDGTRELRVHAIAAPEAPVVVAEGSEPEFSADSAYVACVVGYFETERRRMERDDEPIRVKLALVRLEDGKVEVIDRVESFAFSSDGSHLAYRKYPPESDEDEGEEEEDRDVFGDLVVRSLANGRETLFGSVSELAWQDEGDLLAFTVDAEGGGGNGVNLYEPSKGKLTVLDSGDAHFEGLAWREDGDDLVVLRSRSDEAYEDDTHVLMVFRHLAGEVETSVLDPYANDTFPAGMRISEQTPSWSDDGSTLFLGLQERRLVPEEEEEEDEDEDALPPSNVQVWHARDERIFPMQELEMDDDRERSLLAAVHLDTGRFVQLGSDRFETATILDGQHAVVETDRTPYRFENQFDQARLDLYLVDVDSGTRRKAVEGTWYFEGGSATGRYLLYFAEDAYWAYDVDSDRAVNLTGPLTTSFVDEEYDTPVRAQKPPWGAAGWLANDEAVLLYDRYDVWRVRPDGSGGDRLTRGAEDEVRHRYVELDEEADAIDATSPLYFSLYGVWTKKYGYARLSPTGGLERLVWDDARFGHLARAERADVLAYTRESFDDAPDYFVGAKQVTAIDPFENDYLWGHSELVDFENDRGDRLQGALYYPAGYEPGKSYPMIVYIYEKRAQLVHDYVVPTERRPYNTTVFTQQGYFVFQPDIVYRDRDPGLSALDCVTSGVEAVLAKGIVDREHVGLVGHSWGGYEASYIPMRTTLFAASVAGAPLTNFFSMFGTIHWNQGYPESSHFETGQARMEVPYWDDMEAYVRNSPVMFIRELETPMLVFFGDSDGTVDWHQGVELYNYARRAGKNLVMLVYPGENHSAQEPENQIDYHHRVLAWFDHYLKGDDAPEWITRGVTALERDRAIKGTVP